MRIIYTGIRLQSHLECGIDVMPVEEVIDGEDNIKHVVYEWRAGGVVQPQLQGPLLQFLPQAPPNVTHQHLAGLCAKYSTLTT